MAGAVQTPRDSDRAGTIAVVAIALLILLSANLPHLMGFLKSSEDHVFSGTLSNNLDQLSYYAKMRAGREGNWRYDNLYTTEPSKPVPLFMFYIVLGHASRLTGIPVIAMNQIARIAAGVFLLFMLDRLVRALGWRGGKRALALAFIGLGSGLGWIHGFGFTDLTIEKRPLEYWLIEAYVFQSIANFAHFALATGLLAGEMTETMTAVRDRWTPSRIARLLACAFVMGWVGPRMLAIPVVVFLVASALDGSRRMAWIIGAACVALAGAIPGAIMLFSIKDDPIWRATAEPVMMSPGILQLLAGYGMFWPLAALGAWWTMRGESHEYRWISGWMIAGLLLIWIPLDSQRRLIQGLNIPLALLAILGAEHAARAWIFRGGWNQTGARIAAVALAAILSLGSIFYTVHEVKRIRRGAYPTFWTGEYAAGLAWLERFGRKDEVVMAALQNGALVPAVAGRRVVLGHWSETFHAPGKEREVREFFDTATTSERRAEIVDKHQVTLVIMSNHEAALGAYDPAGEPEKWTQVWKGIDMRFMRRNGLPDAPREPGKGRRR